jgi:hypothetical protein
MIFTSRFGALAARPDFHDPNTKSELEFQREVDELLQAADRKVSSDQRAS